METFVASIRAVANESSPMGLAVVVLATVLVLGAVYILGRRTS